MKRKIYDTLVKWKKSSQGKSAIMIDGARRVGKSWIAEEFAKAEYESYLLIDFGKVSTEVKGFFHNYLEDLDSLFMYLMGEYNVKLIPRKSVLIFDEVQQFPRAREAIKHLVKDGRYDYIETGSLLSISKNTKGIVLPSEEHHVRMFPMDFEEFLIATGNELLMPIIENAFAKMKPVGNGMHRKIMDIFRQYLIVGGMPQAVETFVGTHDLGLVDGQKRDILELYRGDILKHGGVSKHKILSTFDNIPGLLMNYGGRFSPGAVKRGSGMREFAATFEWLKSAMTVNVAYNATEPNTGLARTGDREQVKCYLGDTGLLVSMAFGENELVAGEVQQRLLTGRMEVNTGMLWENVVAQMLRAAGQELYFHYMVDPENPNSRIEVDFLAMESMLHRRKNIIPIEVKGTGEYATSSLDKFIMRFPMYISKAVVLHTKDLHVADDRVYLPVYMAPLLVRRAFERGTYRFRPD